MAKLHVRKDDLVVVISGKDKGKKGKVLAAIPDKGKVIVQGVNIVIKHKKPRSAQEQGGRLNREAPLDASNVMIFCPKCNRPVRIGHKILADGSKIRACSKCGETFEK